MTKDMQKAEGQGYSELRSHVSQVLSEGKERARQAVEQERVRTYWELGGVLVDYLDAHDSVYGKQVMKRLATDVGLSARVLYDTAAFRRQNRKLPTWANLRLKIAFTKSLVTFALNDFEKYRADHGMGENL